MVQNDAHGRFRGQPILDGAEPPTGGKGVGELGEAIELEGQFADLAGDAADVGRGVIGDDFGGESAGLAAKGVGKGGALLQQGRKAVIVGVCIDGIIGLPPIR